MESMHAEPCSPAQVRRMILEKGPSLQAPKGWVLKINWKAFMTPEDWRQARIAESSGSLDDWRDEREDVYG